MTPEPVIEMFRVNLPWHFVRDYEKGKSGEGDYAVSFCGVSVHETWVQRRRLKPLSRLCVRCERGFASKEINASA